jgi:putative endonuclease
MVTERRKTGDVGEEVAAQFLQRKGFKIIDRNFRRPWGEIDLVAEKSGEVRFVEVKTVSRDTLAGVTREKLYSSAEELAHASKLSKVAKTAQLYMEAAKDDRDFQIDVVTVYLNTSTRQATCRLYEQVM